MWKTMALLAVISVLASACGSSNYAGRGHHRPPTPKSDIPLVVNDRVLAWVDYFSGPGKERFARYMKRSGRYEPMIRQIMSSYGMPQDLIYLAMIESGFSSKARSHASAVGVWQFIRSTGNRYGLQQDTWIEERQDAEKATHAAAKYLRDLYNEFNDWYLAMAAYNAGEGTVRRGIAKYGTRNFWELSDSRKTAFRAETRDYVPKFIAAAIVARNPEKFGFKEVQKDDPLNFELVEVDTHVDVDVIARCAEVDTDSIDILNSELRMGTAPPNYHIRIPPGSSKKFRSNLAKIDPKDRVRSVASSETHVVKKGESLRSIARRYKVSTKSILAANGFKSARSIKRGEIISIPVTSSKSSLLARTSGSNLGNNKQMPTVFLADATPHKHHHSKHRGKKVEEPQPTVDVIETVVEEVVVAEEKVGNGYVVTAGDSWNSISQNVGIPTKELKRLNPVVADVGLYVGDVIKLSEDTPVVAVEDVQIEVVESAPKRPPTTYKVKRGDSLGKIADRYGVSVNDIRSWNGISKKNHIRPGQKLRVSGPRSGSSEVGIQGTQKTTTLAKAQGATESGKVITYKVKPGDNLWSIGKRHKISANQIKELSQSGKNQLRPGDVLTLRVDG